jgi:hypothetical protein
MKTSNRILLGFGIGIAALVIITIVLVFTLGQKAAPLLSENTPEGTVQRYLQAIQDKDYTKAYSYIAPIPTPTDYPKGYPPAQSFEYWIQSAQNAANNNWRATLGKTIINGDNATVGIKVEVFRSGGLFNNPVYSNNVTFSLKKVNNLWLITSPTELYWIY